MTDAGGRSSFLFEGWFGHLVVVYCCVAVGKRPDDVLLEPRRFLCDFEGGCEDVDVLVFGAYTGEVFRCEATVDVLTKMFCGEVVCFQLIYVVYCLV
jgi:hypothetical protein